MGKLSPQGVRAQRIAMLTIEALDGDHDATYALARESLDLETAWAFVAFYVPEPELTPDLFDCFVDSFDRAMAEALIPETPSNLPATWGGSG